MGCLESNAVTKPDARNMMLQKCLAAKSYDDQMMTVEAQALCKAYVAKFDLDKDGKLNRKEAQQLLDDTFDVSQRITPLHGGLKDDIQNKEVTHTYQVDDFFWQRYNKGSDLDAESMQTEVRDILFNAFKNAEHMDKRPEAMTSYKLSEEAKPAEKKEEVAAEEAEKKE